MHLAYVRFLLVVTIILSGVVACSSGNDSDSGVPTPSADEGIQPVQAPAIRVVAVSDDVDADGTVDRRHEFVYDADGRVTTVTKTSVASSRPDVVISHSYDGDMLVLRTDTLRNTMYLYESGRLVSVDDGIFGSQRLVYDDAGRIIEVFGAAFLFDDDCEVPISVGADPEFTAPHYRINYDSEQRFISAIGSEGDTLALTYLPNGRVGTLTTSGDCSTAGDSSTEYTYNSMNLPILASTTISSPREELFDPVRDPFDIEFEFDNLQRPVTLITTFYEPENVQRVIRQEFTYDELGQLSSSTTTLSGGALNRTLSAVRTFEYEEQACVEQVYANPVDGMLTELSSVVPIYEAGLRCGYMAEVLDW